MQKSKALTTTTKKRVPVKKPKITDADFKKWFMSLDHKHFIAIQKEWNEKNLNITLKNQKDYDGWLNYFKSLPPNTIRMLASTGMSTLSTEAYAALSRWHDIISNPHRIDKIHQSGLTNNEKKPKNHKTISQLAKENDRLGVLKATRDQIAEKLEKGAGARDTAALAREMTDVMTQIAAYERKLGPKKSTPLAQLIEEGGPIPKRQFGKGTRHVHFASRVTIDDVKEDNE